MSMFKPYQGRSGVRQSESGSILILTAVMMTMLLGVAALALDGSYAYSERNRMSAASDAAAKAAAQELARQGPSTNVCPGGTTICQNLKAFAEHEAALPGFGFASSDVVLNHPPLSGNFAGDSKYVEVIVSHPTPTFLAGALGFASFTPRARSVAGAGASPNCIVALNSTPLTGPQSLVIDLGSGVLGNEGCQLVANNNVHVNWGASITASPFYINGVGRTCGDAPCPGGIIYNNSNTFTPDPLASLTVPTAPVGVPCNALSSTAFNATLHATMPLSGGSWQCYSSISAPSGCTIDFAPGHYYITGNWSTGFNCRFTGTGVFFYMAGASSKLGWASGTVATLTAPTSSLDPYGGILIFLNRTNSSSGAFDAANTDFRFDGAIYGKSALLSFGGATQAQTDCSIIVGGRIGFNNGGAIRNGCTSYAGTVLASISSVAE